MKYLFVFLITSHFCFSQSPYPQDYFRSPLDIPLVLSGTFAELRSNHFHSGLDIKTNQVEGLKVYTIASGYVSRIKVSHYGYGKALYITHLNGYTSVYAHLKKFAPKIEAYVKKHQYRKESFEIELFPKDSEIPISTDEVVAFSGNTGGSGGPHLHFEIRDKNERPINPMLFGIDIKDSKPPFVSRLYGYTKNSGSHINNQTNRIELRLIPGQDGDYYVEDIEASGVIGFGINAYDRQDFAANKNGLSNIKTYYNGSKKFEIDFKRFSYAETKHINRFIDYELYKTKKIYIQKLFIEPGFSLSMYKDVDLEGYVTIEKGLSAVYKIKISDYRGNVTWVTIPIKGVESKVLPPAQKRNDPRNFMYANKANVLEKNNIKVFMPSNTFYDHFFIDFKVSGDTLMLHKDIVPLKKRISIIYNVSGYNNYDKSKLFVAKLNGKNKYPSYINTKRKGGSLIGLTKKLGNFVLMSDETPPIITPQNFKSGKWLSKYRYLKIEIDDTLTGISGYRATVNGKWILMEYDYKKKLLVHDFNDNVVSDIKNEFKLIVTDKVGNSAIYKAHFYRK